MEPFSGNQRPDLRTCLTHAHFFKCPAPDDVVETATKSQAFLSCRKMQNPLPLPLKLILTSRGGPGPISEHFLTSRCVSVHYPVHFLNISTFKKLSEVDALFVHWKILELRFATNVLRVVHVYLQTCFAPQRCAPFQHLNIQKGSKCSNVEVGLTL